MHSPKEVIECSFCPCKNNQKNYSCNDVSLHMMNCQSLTSFLSHQAQLSQDGIVFLADLIEPRCTNWPNSTQSTITIGEGSIANPTASKPHAILIHCTDWIKCNLPENYKPVSFILHRIKEVTCLH